MRQAFTVLAVLACMACTVALELPLTVRSHSMRRPTGSGGLVLAAAKTTRRDISEQEGNFLVDVSIGTPPQNFRLLVRPEATETYVLGKDCDTGVCPDHAKFDGSKSSTYTPYLKDEKCCVGTITNYGNAFPAIDNIV
ncbi:aspartyl protease, partial [Aphelenchoides avenae]